MPYFRNYFCRKLSLMLLRKLTLIMSKSTFSNCNNPSTPGIPPRPSIKITIPGLQLDAAAVFGPISLKAAVQLLLLGHIAIFFATGPRSFASPFHYPIPRFPIGRFQYGSHESSGALRHSLTGNKLNFQFNIVGPKYRKFNHCALDRNVVYIWLPWKPQIAAFHFF